MSYESPIEIAEKMSSQIENDIMKTIAEYEIKVDKDELVKALLYDRKQYEKGYADGQRAGERTAKVEELEKRSETSMSWEGICTNCSSYTMHEMNYCFHCGCRLEWE